MKLFRNAIILIVIVALMGAAYYFINKNKSSTGSTDNAATNGATNALQIINYNTDDISQMTIQNSEGTMIITRKGTDWVLTSPTDWKADPSKLSSIVLNASTIVADKFVGDGSADLAQYGLDKPVIETFKMNDGTEKTFEIGSMTPTKEDYYIMLKDTNKVYTISSYTAETLLEKKNDIRDRTLYTLKSDDVTSFSMERKGENVFTSTKGGTASWSMLTPIQGSVDSSALQPMLDAVTGSTVLNYIEDNPTDLSKYGLANPAYELDFGTSSANYKLLLGDEETKGSVVYAMLSGNNTVFTLDESAFTFLDKPLKEILSVFAFIVDIDQVNKIEVTMDGQLTTMGFDVYKAADGTSDADKDKFTLNGKDASGKDKDGIQPFRKFFEGLISVCLDDIEPAAVPSGTPEISIKYYLKTAPDIMQVDFVPKDANDYYVLRNGKYAGITVKKDKQEFGIGGMKAAFKTMTDFQSAQK